MHDNGIEELITKLYDMVQDARSLPLGADKCIVERDKVLDMLDEISNQLPGELKQAKTIVDSRNELIAKAKREAEGIVRTAEERARNMVAHEEIVRQAQQKANEVLSQTQQKAREMRKGANDFSEDVLRRTEETLAQRLSEVRQARQLLRNPPKPQEGKPEEQK